MSSFLLLLFAFLLSFPIPLHLRSLSPPPVSLTHHSAAVSRVAWQLLCFLCLSTSSRPDPLYQSTFVIVLNCWDSLSSLFSSLSLSLFLFSNLPFSSLFYLLSFRLQPLRPLTPADRPPTVPRPSFSSFLLPLSLSLLSSWDSAVLRWSNRHIASPG
ncbi:hypothetical protein BDV59DRAFT_2597 [Aspergillus ambiguus]|uniref:uncharacterized protein n=1 Tax=Aspergillus ambiguus TaxID=176160 RepID=UPI003CCD454D